MVSLQQPFGFSAPTASWGVRGSRTAPYCGTPEIDSGNITSISAMSHYKDRTHEELRFEDYELGKGSSLPIQNQGTAFQRSNSPFGPVPVPSSHFLSGSLSGSTFGTATAALVSDSSVKPPFGSMSTGFGVASSTQTFNFNPTPATPPSFSTLGGTSSPFGIPNMPPSTASIGTSTFRSPSASFPEGGSSFPAFNVSTTSAFGSVPPSAPSTASSGFGTSTFRSPSASFSEGSSFPAFNVSAPAFGSTSSSFGVPRSAPSTFSSSFGTSTFRSPSASFPEGGSSCPAFNVSTTSSFGSTTSSCCVPPFSPCTFSSGFGTSTFRSPSASFPEGGSSFPSFNVSTTSAFGSTSSSFGVPPSAPSTFSSGFGTSTFRSPSASVPEGGSSFPAFNVSTTPAFCSTSSTFGMYNMSPSAPSTASTGFGTSTVRSPSASVPEGGLSFPAFNVSTTPAFCSTSSTFGMYNMPPSAPCTTSTGFGTSTFRFPSAPVPEGGLSFSSFNVSTTPAFSTSSPFGVSNMTSSAPSAASSSFGTSTFRFPSAPVPEGGLRFSPFNVSTTSAFSTSSPFGVSNMTSSAPSAASSSFGTSTFRFPSAPVPEGGLRFSPFNVSTTSAFSTSSPFGVSNMPSSAPSASSSSFGTSTFRFPVAPGTSNNPVSTISGCFGSMPAPGIQTSSGSLDTTAAKYQRSGVVSYSSTREYDSSNNKFSGMMIQSISAMPSYKDKSHEELRSQDYGLCNTGGQKLSVETSDSPNRSSVHAQYNFSGPSRENFINPSNTIFTAPTPSPPVNPFCFTNVFPSQAQSFTLQPDRASVMPTFPPTQNPPSFIPFTAPVHNNTSQSAGAFSLEQPSVIIPPSIQSTSVTASDPWPSIAEIAGPFSQYPLNKPSQAPSGPTTVQFTSQNINGQQNIPSSTLGVESSPVVNPFATQFPVNPVTPRQHGISSMPVSDNLSSKRTSLMRIRHVSSRHTGLVTQKPNVRSSETKVPFFINKEDIPGPVAPFLPRENPRAWVNISMSLCSRQGKGDEVKEDSIAIQVEENSTSLTDDEDRQQQHQDDVAPRTERRVDDVLALLPKLPDEDYYTEPSLHELAAKEMAEAGFCSHVKDFVVGRKGYGSIKYLGETDVRHLDIKSAVQFNKREVIVYPDETKKPQVGQQLNKAAEVSILNVKCIDKKTGKQYVKGHQIRSYQEILMNKSREQGAEFVSYDPVEGEWKFRVQHF